MTSLSNVAEQWAIEVIDAAAAVVGNARVVGDIVSACEARTSVEDGSVYIIVPKEMIEVLAALIRDPIGTLAR